MRHERSDTTHCCDAAAGKVAVSVRDPIFKGAEFVRDGEGRIHCYRPADHATISPNADDVCSSILSECVPGGLRLPVAPGNYEATRTLFENLQLFFNKHPGLSYESSSKLVFFTLATWFQECSPLAPCLWIFSPDGCASALLIRMLHCVCRCALRIAGLTRSSIFALPLDLNPTLIVDEPAPSREVERTLRAIMRPGTFVLHGQRARDVSCAIVVSSRVPLLNVWLLEGALHVNVLPIMNLPSLNAEALEACAQDLQGKLFDYRRKNVHRVREAQVDTDGLLGATAEIARMLGAAVVDDFELRSQIVPLLKPQDAELRVQRSTAEEAIALEAALFLCHEENRRSAYVGEFTTIVNSIYLGRGEELKLTARAVGGLLRAVGLCTQELGSAGRGIVFTNDVRRKIHDMAFAHGVKSVQDERPSCKFCAEAIRRSAHERRNCHC